MSLMLFLEFVGDIDYSDYSAPYLPEPSRIKNKKANIFIRFKWFVLILLWKFNNRKWNKCKKKDKALNKYKTKLMKGYVI